jgi:hypothetical protein
MAANVTKIATRKKRHPAERGDGCRDRQTAEDGPFDPMNSRRPRIPSH